MVEIGLEIKVCSLAPDLADIDWWDAHLGFRSTCMVHGDHGHLRPIFGGQILCFIAEANEDELAEISRAVAVRARSAELRKKRGRPSIRDGDELLLQAKCVAWWEIVEERSLEWIAKSLDIRIIPARRNARGIITAAGNVESVRRRIARYRSYFAAALWRAVAPSWIVQTGEHRGELKPGILDHKPAQQMIWVRTGLPFRQRPEECKAIVTALWPRALTAAAEISERHFRYHLAKQHGAT